MHLLHTSVLSLSEYVPGGHGRQNVFERNVPAGHVVGDPGVVAVAEHDACPLADVCPSGHSTHSDDFALECVPDGHGILSVDPAC